MLKEIRTFGQVPYTASDSQIPVRTIQDADLSPIRMDKIQDAVDRGGLAGAVVAQQREEAAARYGEGDSLDSADGSTQKSGAKGLGQIHDAKSVGLQRFSAFDNIRLW